MYTLTYALRRLAEYKNQYEMPKWDSYSFLRGQCFLLDARSELSWAVWIHLGINTVMLERELLFLPVDTEAQWDGWEINGDISGLCFLCSLMWPHHECRCAAWQLVFYAFHACRHLAELTKCQLIHGAAGKLICQCVAVHIVENLIVENDAFDSTYWKSEYTS